MDFYTCSVSKVTTQEMVVVLGDSDAAIQKLGTLTHINLHKPLQTRDTED
jgi:hypothetical protein